MNRLRKQICLIGSIPNPRQDIQFRALFELLESKNYEISEEIGNEYLIAINHNQAELDEFLRRGGAKENTVLLRPEPDAVFPAQYKQKIFRQYGLVITPGGDASVQLTNQRFEFPYQINIDPNNRSLNDPDLEIEVNHAIMEKRFDLENWLGRPIKTSMVISNKVSPVPRSNYAIRRLAALEISPEELEVYGTLWTSSFKTQLRHRVAVAVFAIRSGYLPNPRSIFGSLGKSYPTAKGVVANKHSVLKNSKFSLVIENTNTHITEKIFDAIINGAVPIYVGPNLKELGIPSDIAFEVSADILSIKEALGSYNPMIISRKLKAIQEFLTSEIFWKDWSAPKVHLKIALEIDRHFQK